MKILVTAGNTQTPMDDVRCITNIFSGMTGSRIAFTAWERGHDVTLLTSHPEIVRPWFASHPERWEVRDYRTFDELRDLMAELITPTNFDAIIHAAAVSDYALAGIYSQEATGMVDVRAGKVKSSYPELWLRLTPTPKLVDQIRPVWGFQGVLVKFKLEVGVTEDELLRIAEKSRLQSGADLMVANTLEGKDQWALMGAVEYQRIERAALATRLLERVESLMKHPK
jgi:phosphopantothenate-cysteine ligase/phosphopantothenoylcysteine decarboxylase/phosphopantothenate--cysteine ligase